MVVAVVTRKVNITIVYIYSCVCVITNPGEIGSTVRPFLYFSGPVGGNRPTGSRAGHGEERVPSIFFLFRFTRGDDVLEFGLSMYSYYLSIIIVFYDRWRYMILL